MERAGPGGIDKVTWICELGVRVVSWLRVASRAGWYLRETAGSSLRLDRWERRLRRAQIAQSVVVLTFLFALLLSVFT